MFWSNLFQTNNDIPTILGGQKLAAASTPGLLSLRFNFIRGNKKAKKQKIYLPPTQYELRSSRKDRELGMDVKLAFVRPRTAYRKREGFSTMTEAVYKRSPKLDQSPSKIMRFSAFFVRGAEGYPKGEQALFPFWSGVGEAPRL
ncbi:hypothetical protein Q4591_00020 [Shewanella sp. 3_MG-2023]|uniref:hypothetical protein n=1 Tax=Shewanella sp. 3_MG-2023 TaxID=3062635 RepID=UPI0026E34479|nr:hypothetical protein [Shewanella sp. 3_MG-2023]MDO6773727.1 hypothetical protein [Shewanella sp. 3_MG-2023]